MQNENINILNLFYNFYRYKYGIFIIISLTLISSYFYIKQEIPIYSSNILIGIEKDEYSSIKALFPNSNVVNIDMDSKLDYEIKILKSYRIVSNVLNKVDFYNRVYIKDKWKTQEVDKALIPFSMIVINNIDDNKKITFQFKELDNSQFYIIYDGQEYKYRYKDIVTINNIKIKFGRNHNIPHSHFTYIIKIDKNIKEIVHNIINNISITKEANRLLNISYSDEIPTRIKTFLTTLINTYREDNLRRLQDKDTKNILFYNRAIKELKETLKSIGNKLKQYKSIHSELYMVGSENELFLNLLKEKRELPKLSLQLNNLKTTKSKVLNGNYSTELLENSLFSIKGLNKLLNEYIEKKIFLKKLFKQSQNTDLLILKDTEYIYYIKEIEENENKLNQLQEEFTDNYPDIRVLKETIENKRHFLTEYLNNKIDITSEELETIRTRIIKAIDNLIESTQKKLDSIKKGISKNDKIIKKIPNSLLEFQILQREFDLNEENYKRLLKKRSEAIISKASNILNIDIIDIPTIPKTPIKPKKKFIYLSGILIGLIFSILYISIRRYFNKIVESKGDIPAGEYKVIEYTSKTIWQIIGIYENNPINSNIIAVTTSSNKENKKDTIVELGMNLDSIGKRVLIIDFDIYNGKFSSSFSSYKTGLTNILTSKHSCKDINIEKYINKDVHGYGNIDMLFSGPIFPNSSALLFDKKIGELLTLLKEEYHYILIDFPPIGKYPIVHILSKYVDNSLFIVEIGKTEKSFFNILHETIININNKIILYYEKS